MTTYFFRHSIKAQIWANNSVPGRYRYDVTGCALVATADRFEPREFKGSVFGDAIADNTPGSNVDPNVLSDVIPWFLSYCLIEKRDEKRCVADDNRRSLLSEIVRPGDLIVFGNYVNSRVIFVDTVFCVSTVLVIPQSGGNLDIQEYHRQHGPELGLPDWEDFKKTRAYLLNLKAGRPGGSHHEAHINPHLQIVGTRKQNHPATINKDSLLQQCLAGEGFNFIPLKQSYESSNNEIATRRPLFSTDLFDFAKEIKQNSINPLKDGDASRLLRAIVHQSDELVLDPIAPTNLSALDDSACS
jgi:hypothetical protein